MDSCYSATTGITSYPLSPLLLIIAFTLKNINTQVHLKSFLFITSNSILLANLVKFPLKFIFGRYWPQTFKGNNLSLLHDGAYGFNPFHWGINYSSFPSGHTATVFAFVTIVWAMYPRFRWISVIMCKMVSIALMVLYYHFVSDLLAGAYMGIVIGIIVYTLLQKKMCRFLYKNLHISTG